MLEVYKLQKFGSNLITQISPVICRRTSPGLVFAMKKSFVGPDPATLELSVPWHFLEELYSSLFQTKDWAEISFQWLKKPHRQQNNKKVTKKPVAFS